MASIDLRTSQLIVPHGPGSFYFDKRGIPFIVGGLDFWFRRYNSKESETPKAADHVIVESRLSELLGVGQFRKPPIYSLTKGGGAADRESHREIPMMRFPAWYRNVLDSKLKRYSVFLGRDPEIKKGAYWQPVRFVAMCDHGHITEFPWKEFVGCTCVGDGDLVMRDDGGTDLRSVAVRCSTCPPDSTAAKWRTLVNAVNGRIATADSIGKQQKQFIKCSGTRPWLGEEKSRQACDQDAIGALINQSNIYYANIVSAISLPPVLTNSNDLEKVENILVEDIGTFALAMEMFTRGQTDQAVSYIHSTYAYARDVLDKEIIIRVLTRRLHGSDSIRLGAELTPAEPEDGMQAYRRLERNILRSTDVQSAVKDAPLKVQSVDVPALLSSWIDRVNIVDQLAETRVFCGFDRNLPARRTPAQHAERALQQLFLHPPKEKRDTWLPAVRVYGEGLYIELRNEPIQKWQRENSAWIQERFTDAYRTSLVRSPNLVSPANSERDIDWISRFHIVHTLAHLLINELVFYCGYGASALRERLFVSADAKAPMASMLLYTTSGDMHGTLGGLVELGRPEQLGTIIRRAIDKARWCSSDPVCSYDIGTNRHAELTSLAACHACALLPEVSCENMNKGLDRAVLVGLPDNREVGFFKDLL